MKIPPCLACPQSDRLRRRSFVSGFTLVEMMIAVAIAGILAALAYPSFMSQIRKSRRSDAVLATTQIQQIQERWRANNATYASTPTALGLSTTSPNGYYTLAIASATASTYSITATAVAGKSQTADTGCTPLVLNVSNGTATPASSSASCWSK